MIEDLTRKPPSTAKLSYLQCHILVQIFDAEYPKQGAEPSELQSNSQGVRWPSDFFQSKLQSNSQGVRWSSDFFQSFHGSSRHAISTALHSLERRNFLSLKAFNEGNERTEFVSINKDSLQLRDEITELFEICFLYHISEHLNFLEAHKTFGKYLLKDGKFFVGYELIVKKRKEIRKFLERSLIPNTQQRIDDLMEIIEWDLKAAFRKRVEARHLSLSRNALRSLPSVIREAEILFLTRQRRGQIKSNAKSPRATANGRSRRYSNSDWDIHEFMLRVTFFVFRNKASAAWSYARVTQVWSSEDEIFSPHLSRTVLSQLEPV